MADAVTLHSLPLFVRLAGRPVILIGDGAAAEAKRRLLNRAGAMIVGEAAAAALAIVAIEDDADAHAAIDRLKARGVLVNAVDRAALCDFTLPAIVERGAVLVAVATGGASAGLAAALRQRIEALLPHVLGSLADQLYRARSAMRARYPDPGERRQALGAALAAGGALDPLAQTTPEAVTRWLAGSEDRSTDRLVTIRLRADDPDELTLREARLLAQADRIYYRSGVPAAVLDRARADAERLPCPAPSSPKPGLSIDLEPAR